MNRPIGIYADRVTVNWSFGFNRLAVTADICASTRPPAFFSTGSLVSKTCFVEFMAHKHVLMFPGRCAKPT